MSWSGNFAFLRGQGIYFLEDGRIPRCHMGSASRRCITMGIWWRQYSARAYLEQNDVVAFSFFSRSRSDNDLKASESVRLIWVARTIVSRIPCKICKSSSTDLLLQRNDTLFLVLSKFRARLSLPDVVKMWLNPTDLVLTNPICKVNFSLSTVSLICIHYFRV